MAADRAAGVPGPARLAREARPRRLPRLALIGSLLLLTACGSGCGQDCARYGDQYVPGHYVPGHYVAGTTICSGSGTTRRCSTSLGHYTSGYFQSGYTESICLEYKGDR